MVSKSTQDESEKTAKVYQINALSDRVDIVIQAQEDLKNLILNQNQTYPTKTELALELEKRDNRIESLERTVGNYSRVVWTLVTAFVPMLALSVWQLIVNAAKGGNQ